MYDENKVKTHDSNGSGCLQEMNPKISRSIEQARKVRCFDFKSIKLIDTSFASLRSFVFSHYLLLQRTMSRLKMDDERDDAMIWHETVLQFKELVLPNNKRQEFWKKQENIESRESINNSLHVFINSADVMDVSKDPKTLFLFVLP